ncbi:hypothetical protein [Amycolatopsis suaedae]|uniref:Uncharacterized protein n=1 Tax=Amycolatopsis suaedae TaxID=2510978 RepID=A0A4Q7JC04_9PSEU|nr:hypothetical protein [Amycolatopsis suaedae]RZQ64566.1 hypothetical protein EWH70_06555 [Amycolatopsis suaedae]
MFISRRASAGAILAALVMAGGCGSGDDDRADEPQAPESPGPPSVSEPPEGKTELRGVVRPGVEPGCLLLSVNGTDYLLLGRDQDDDAVLRPGATVVVRGEPAEGQVTTCQQGTPFQVEESHPG